MRNALSPLVILGVLVGAAGPASGQEGAASAPDATKAAPPATPAVATPAPYVPSFLAPRTFSVGGYIQSQVGIFVSPDKDAYDAEGLPTDHGGKLGKLSMARNTFQLELNWQPHRIVQVHALLRGVLGPPLRVDADAQVPDPGYRNDPERRATWVAERYNNEFDLREFYVDLQPHPIFNLRVGRQLVAWGETGSARLLDVVNPVDATWHFGALESFEDQRIPLWMVKATVEIPALAGALDVVWVPMMPHLGRFGGPERSVTTPLTFVGAWGLPAVPKQLDESILPKRIYQKTFLYPDRFAEDSRVGARWKGSLGPWIGYSLMYYWTQQVTPPIPKYYVTTVDHGFDGNDVVLDFPRQHIVGLSLEGNAPWPAATMVKFEASFEPDRTYPVHSGSPKAVDETTLTGDVVTYFDCVDYKNCSRTRKKTLNYAVTLLQPFYIRAVNPEQPFLLTLQWSDSVVFGYDKTTADQGPCSTGECLLDVPGYDSTVLTRHRYQLVAALSSTFLRGLVTPRIVGAWLPRQDGNRVTRGGGFVSVGAAFAFDDHWRLNVALNEFFGTDPYNGVGLFRDRDEVNVALRYQF